MALRRLAGLAIGLALPLTFVGAASADYSDNQVELLDQILDFDDEDDGYDISLPIDGGIFVIEDGERRSGADIYDDIENASLFGDDDD